MIFVFVFVYWPKWLCFFADTYFAAICELKFDARGKFSDIEVYGTEAAIRELLRTNRRLATSLEESQQQANRLSGQLSGLRNELRQMRDARGISSDDQVDVETLAKFWAELRKSLKIPDASIEQIQAKVQELSITHLRLRKELSEIKKIFEMPEDASDEDLFKKLEEVVKRAKTTQRANGGSGNQSPGPGSGGAGGGASTAGPENGSRRQKAPETSVKPGDERAKGPVAAPGKAPRAG